MDKKLMLFFCATLFIPWACAQQTTGPSPKEKPLYTLIDQYAQARETKDTVLLKQILTDNIDQLVSTGEWRRGFETAKQGMLRSSSANPGSRTLTVDQIRFLSQKTAVVDTRYEIENADGSLRKMWSTFIVVYEGKRWKISAIRNMLPAGGS
ncbi:hypothetical protein SAMN05421636_101166 [Pricia antarctica]|uniref:DUF4440 domain-containing protein n=1 Tax=Pricia antarctica TaxID=641691 RepID=A0A1G6W507_9FLAO|nr:DUF4440 domain-containing protein [Pricia antarctica]SDD60125.1 hypothetical protein SAMN05421636_101166 [Pricia antarctica]